MWLPPRLQLAACRYSLPATETAKLVFVRDYYQMKAWYHTPFLPLSRCAGDETLKNRWKTPFNEKLHEVEKIR